MEVIRTGEVHEHLGRRVTGTLLTLVMAGVAFGIVISWFAIGIVEVMLRLLSDSP